MAAAVIERMWPRQGDESAAVHEPKDGVKREAIASKDRKTRNMKRSAGKPWWLPYAQQMTSLSDVSASQQMNDVGNLSYVPAFQVDEIP